MGLLKAFNNAVGGVLADQWKEYYYCDALDANTLVKRGCRRILSKSSNYQGSPDIISNGSVIAVADGQCMMIVEQGKIVEVSAEPGEYVYDSSTESSVFAGKLDKQAISEVLQNIKKRFGFGGQAAKDQRVYYFNIKECTGNCYGTPAPVPFRVVDENIGLDMDITIRCFGEYSYHITNPVLFYTNVCGNIDDVFVREEIDGQLKSELLTSLQPAFAELSNMGIRYSALPGHTAELAGSLNKILSDKWKNARGIEIASLGISSIKAGEKDEEIIKELQRNAAFRDPTMAAAQLVGAQSIAMQEAARNQNAGSAMAFMGMNMANQTGGIDAQSLFQMGMAHKNQMFTNQQSEDTWNCQCGNVAVGKFCSNCGLPKPDSNSFYCNECGWKMTDSSQQMRFCPQCGKPLLNKV